VKNIQPISTFKPLMLDYAKAASRVEDAVRLVHIAQFTTMNLRQLSDGELKRVATARALVARKRLLLLDERMAHLAADLKTDLLNEFTALPRSLGVTTIYITHYRAEAQVITHCVLTMRNGRVAQNVSDKERPPQTVMGEQCND
jgi:ABC-type Fe3+/spermidine/putrescine transport system ATPase subunit